MDEERRRKERRARAATEDPEAFLAEALAHRRAGQLEAARAALESAVDLAPTHELARALLLLTEVALGKRTRGAFGEARGYSVDLARFLDAPSMREVARSALDPAHGPVDAEAVAALVETSKEGAIAVLDALADADLGKLADRARIAIGLRAREIARWEIEPHEVSAALRAKVARQVERADPDWLLLAGAIHMRELRRQVERALASPRPPERYCAAFALELMGDLAALPSLTRALDEAASRGDREVIERALEGLTKRG